MSNSVPSDVLNGNPGAETAPKPEGPPKHVEKKKVGQWDVVIEKKTVEAPVPKGDLSDLMDQIKLKIGTADEAKVADTVPESTSTLDAKAPKPAKGRGKPKQNGPSDAANGTVPKKAGKGKGPKGQGASANGQAATDGPTLTSLIPPAVPRSAPTNSPIASIDPNAPLSPPTTFTYDHTAPFHQSRVHAWSRLLLTHPLHSRPLTPETLHLFAFICHTLRLRGRQYVLRLKNMIGYTGPWRTFFDLLSDAKGIFVVRSPYLGKSHPKDEPDAATFRIGLYEIRDPEGVDYLVGIPRAIGASSIDTIVAFAFRLVWEAGGVLSASRLDDELSYGFSSMAKEWRNELSLLGMALTAPYICQLKPDLFSLEETVKRDAGPRSQRAKYVILKNNDVPSTGSEATQLRKRIGDVFANAKMPVLRLEQLAVLAFPNARFDSPKLPFPQCGLANFLVGEEEYLVCDAASGIDVPSYMVARLPALTEETVGEKQVPEHPLWKIPAVTKMVDYVKSQILRKDDGILKLGSLHANHKAYGVDGELVRGVLELVGGWEQFCRILDEAAVLEFGYEARSSGRIQPIVKLPMRSFPSVAAPEEAPSPAYFDAFGRDLMGEMGRKLPTLEDVRLRQVVLDRIQKNVAKLWGAGIDVFAFGSTSNGLGTKDDDLDICIVTTGHGVSSDGPWLNTYTLASVLRLCGFSSVVPIAHARVPIVKFSFVSNYGTEVKGDVNVNNCVALWNTALLRSYCVLDPRVRMFLLAVKHWSKQRQVNNPSGGWLSSYSFVLMGLTFLVARGVVPCLQAVEGEKMWCETVLPGSGRVPRGKRGTKPDGAVPMGQKVDVTFRTHEEVRGGKREIGTGMVPPGFSTQLVMLENEIAGSGWRSENTETIASLLHGFFATYASFPRRTSTVSLRDGKFVLRTKDRFRGDAMVVEDPFIEHNTTRNASELVCGTLMTEFKRAADMISSQRTFGEVCEAWVEPTQKGTENGGRL